MLIFSQQSISRVLAQAAACFVLLLVLLLWTCGAWQVETQYAEVNIGKARGPDTMETNGLVEDPLGAAVMNGVSSLCTSQDSWVSFLSWAKGEFACAYEKGQVQDFVCA